MKSIVVKESQSSHGGNLFCQRRGHPIEIHIARN